MSKYIKGKNFPKVFFSGRTMASYRVIPLTSRAYEILKEVYAA